MQNNDYEETKNKVFSLIGQTEYAKSLKIATQYLDKVSKNSITYVKTLQLIGTIYQSKADYNNSLNFYNLAWNTFQNLNSDDIFTETLLLLNLANAERSLHHYEKAEEYFKSAENKIGTNTIFNIHAILYNGIGSLYYSKEEFTKAEEYLKKSRIISRKYNEDEIYAKATDNLAEVYAKLGKYEESEQLHLESLKIQEIFFNENHPDIINNLINLAGVYRDWGKLDEAKKNIDKVLSKTEKSIGKKNPIYLNALEFLSVLYRIMGDEKNRESISKEIHSIREEILPEDGLDEAKILNKLALENIPKKEYKKALELVLKGLKIRERNLPEDHTLIANSYSLISVILVVSGHPNEAITYHTKARDIVRKVYGEDHPAFASILLEHGMICERLKNYQRAQDYLELSKEIIENVGIDTEDYATCLFNLGLVYARRGNYEESLKIMKKAIKIENKLLWDIFSISSESQKLQFMNQIRRNFEIYLSLVIQQFRDSKEEIYQAYDFTLQRKGLTFDALVIQNKNFSNHGDKKQSDEIFEYYDIRKSISDLIFNHNQQESQLLSDLVKKKTKLKKIFQDKFLI